VELRKIRRKKGELNLPLVYLPVVGTLVLLIGLLYLFKRLPNIPCIFKTVTGYPCPTCGSTRMLLNLLHLDIAAAFHWNPLVFLCGLAFIAWVFYGFYMLISGEKIQVILTGKESRVLVLILGVLFALNWFYLLIIL
jgi:hypothetical protein